MYSRQECTLECFHQFPQYYFQFLKFPPLQGVPQWPHFHQFLGHHRVPIGQQFPPREVLDFIEENGERLGALLTLRDAESMREIEGEIELSRRLADVGRLTRGVGHEVKNPINAIVLHLQLLRNKLTESDPDTRRHMDIIAGEIQRLDRFRELGYRRIVEEAWLLPVSLNLLITFVMSNPAFP